MCFGDKTAFTLGGGGGWARQVCKQQQRLYLEELRTASASLNSWLNFELTELQQGSFGSYNLTRIFKGDEHRLQKPTGMVLNLGPGDYVLWELEINNLSFLF